MEKQGLVHIYTGNGKGKTTAAFGLAMRMVGSGGRAEIIQFMKGEKTSEVLSAEKLGISCVLANPGIGFVNTLTAEEYAYHKALAKEALIRAAEDIKTADLLVLDEAVCAVDCGFLEEGDILRFISNKPFAAELVLTGAGATERLFRAADYASVIHKEKHPYDKGTVARPGIEY